MARPITEAETSQCIYHDGDLLWKHSRANDKVKAGDIAGSIASGGYKTTKIKNVTYRIHRLIWAMHHGDPGELEVDHIDRDTSNNRIENLRLATKAINMQNEGKGARPTSKSGVRGVSWHKQRGKWVAQINAKGRKRHLGLFDSVEEAEAAYVAARNELHPGHV